MRQASREPTLRDTSRWLGQTPDEPDTRWWEGVVPELDVDARLRVARQLFYLRRIGVEVDADLLAKVVEEAIEFAEQRRNDSPSSIGPITTVYYLRIGGLIKIGQTINLDRRLHAYPPGTVVLATESGPRDVLEAERHAQFGHQRISPQRREWFHPSAELIEHINSLREQPLTAAELAA